MPGAVDTAITANSGVDGPGIEEGGARMTSAAKAARTMLDGIERDRLHIYVGPDAKLMSLAIKLAPRRSIRFVKQQMAKRERSATPVRG
jgi:short-subunit dehydrogenase